MKKGGEFPLRPYGLPDRVFYHNTNHYSEKVFKFWPSYKLIPVYLGFLSLLINPPIFRSRFKVAREAARGGNPL